MLFVGRDLKRQAAYGLMLLTLAKEAASDDETWINTMYEEAMNLASDEERSVALKMVEKLAENGQSLMPSDPVPYYAPTADAVAADASLLSVLRRVARNPLEAIPAPAYHVRMTRQKLFGKDVWFVTDPDLVAQILVADWLDYPKSPLMKRSLGPLWARVPC